MSPPRHGIIRAETDTWQPVRFQFKERSNTLFRSASFLHTELHISCNISSSHGALMTKLPEQHATPHSQHSLPARLSAPDIPCSASSRSHGRERFQGGHCLQQSPGRAAHLEHSFLKFFLLLSFPLYFFLVSGQDTINLKSD